VALLLVERRMPRITRMGVSRSSVILLGRRDEGPGRRCTGRRRRVHVQLAAARQCGGDRNHHARRQPIQKGGEMGMIVAVRHA
jgi:hypothetical protein